MKYWLLAGIALMLLVRPAQADTTILDVGPAFPVGPYSTLYVDRANPQRIAIGTSGGEIAWSNDGAAEVHESRARSPRRYDAMAIRGEASNSGLGSAAGSDGTEHAVRLFIQTLETGKGVARWHYWRAISDPVTEISSVRLPPPGGGLLAVTPAGILVSDDKGGHWTRTLGAPGTMPREEKDLVGLSVVANPVNPSIVLAGTSVGVFMSTDGGMNFSPHTNSTIMEEMVFEFIWDEMDPDVVLAIGADTIMQSADAGRTFNLAYISPAEINSVVISDQGVYLATVAGLILFDGEENKEVLTGESILGVVPWGNGEVLALSSKNLYLIDALGERTTLMRTTATDPFLRLDGAADLAFMLSATGVYRIGKHEPRTPAKKVPVMTMSMSKTQQSVLNHLGLGDPDDTRLHPRWYADLLPSLEFNAVAWRGSDAGLTQDFALPIAFRFARTGSRLNTEFSIMASWDLTTLLFGDSHAANPNLFIESTLRANRDQILGEVRSRYRQAAILTKRLQNPPTDPKIAFLWRMRLEEHTSYLEYATGRAVVEEKPMEQAQ